MRRLACILAILVLDLIPMAHAASTLETVRARGALRCGTENDTPGSGAPDSQGVLQGIDIEFCRGLAAAWLGHDVEGHAFAATIYFIFCFGASRYAAWLERRMAAAPRLSRADRKAQGCCAVVPA